MVRFKIFSFRVEYLQDRDCILTGINSSNQANLLRSCSILQYRLQMYSLSFEHASAMTLNSVLVCNFLVVLLTQSLLFILYCFLDDIHSSCSEKYI